MSKIVLLAVAAAWAAVLIPPLVRSRVDNRPNSSVSDFRRQLSSLERVVPTRTMVPMRGMARPLTQAPRQRPLPGQPIPALPHEGRQPLWEPSPARMTGDSPSEAPPYLLENWWKMQA